MCVVGSVSALAGDVQPYLLLRLCVYIYIYIYILLCICAHLEPFPALCTNILLEPLYERSVRCLFLFLCLPRAIKFASRIPSPTASAFVTVHLLHYATFTFLNMYSCVVHKRLLRRFGGGSL